MQTSIIHNHSEGKLINTTPKKLFFFVENKVLYKKI